MATKIPNKYMEYKDYYEIIITNKYNEEKCRAIIDKEDFELVFKYRWHTNNSGYPITKINGRDKFLHNILFKRYYIFDRSIVIDHINRNKLDNRRSNLRLCNQQINSLNSSKSDNIDSGVYYSNGKYVFKLKCIGRRSFYNKNIAICERKRLISELKNVAKYDETKFSWNKR